LSFACFSQVLLGVLPTVFLIPLAQKSYMSIKHRQSTQKGLVMSHVHFYKALLTCLLVLLPIGKLLKTVQNLLIAKMIEQIVKGEKSNMVLSSTVFQSQYHIIKIVSFLSLPFLTGLSSFFYYGKNIKLLAILQSISDYFG
jgi:hypothetical protein